MAWEAVVAVFGGFHWWKKVRDGSDMASVVTRCALKLQSERATVPIGPAQTVDIVVWPAESCA